nr:hypothetical protein [Tanacetum cinerariifolium]
MEGTEAPKEWTVEEETALCQRWCNISENSMNAKGFCEAVIRYFEKEIGSSRVYDSIVSKLKFRVRPRIGAFCVIIKNIEANHESGTNDIDRPCWKDVEMPHFYQTQGRKKFKTSETTSGSASGGLNLNEEANEAVEPMGRDRAKTKKKATGPLVGDLLHLLIW